MTIKNLPAKLPRPLFLGILIAAGLCSGFFLGKRVCEWWLLPRWVQEFPHDGQLGLGVFAFAVGGALLGGLIGLVSGIALADRGLLDLGED